MNRYILIAALFVAQGGLAEDCAIVTVMKQKRESADTRSQAMIENLVQNPDLQKNACLPITEKLGGMISTSLPSISTATIKGIAEAVKKAACGAVNSAIEEGAGKMKVGWEAPYGMGGVGAGTNTTGQTGVEHGTGTTIDVGGAVTDVFTDGIENNVEGAMDGLGNDISGGIGVQHNDARTIEEEWRQIRDSLYE